MTTYNDMIDTQDISEKQGNVYSLGGFTKAFNRGEINNTDIIRII